MIRKGDTIGCLSQIVENLGRAYGLVLETSMIIDDHYSDSLAGMSIMLNEVDVLRKAATDIGSVALISENLLSEAEYDYAHTTT